MGSAGTEWDTADVLTKARLNQKNIFVGTGSQINVLTPTFTGMIVFCTTSGSGFSANIYYKRNYTNTSWSPIGVDESPYLTVSTTIGDYTTPASATASSETGTTATITDNFSSDNFTDVGSGIEVSGGVLGGSFNRSATNNGSYRAITALSDTTWLCRFKMIINSVSTETNGVFIGLSDTIGTSGSSAARDGLGLFIRYDGGLFSTICAPNGVTWATTFTNMTTAPSVTTIYVTMKRLSSTSFTVAYSSTAAYSEDIESKNITVSSSIIGLDNFIIQNMNDGLSSTDDFDVDIDDLKIYDGITTATSFLAVNAVDTFTDTNWKSTSEANPSIYVDLTSNREIVGIALNIDNTATTITSVKIRASTDITFTDAENIAYISISDFTDDTWRFLATNFLADNRRYVQFYANETGVFSINEIKVRYGVSDTTKLLSHKHRTRLTNESEIFTDTN